MSTPKMTHEELALAEASRLVHEAYQTCRPPGADTPPGKLGDAARLTWESYVKIRALLGDIVK